MAGPIFYEIKLYLDGVREKHEGRVGYKLIHGYLLYTNYEVAFIELL